jgi:1-acyl-sn-glycerol-3-phosphate acyltransferase
MTFLKMPQLSARFGAAPHHDLTHHDLTHSDLTHSSLPNGALMPPREIEDSAVDSRVSRWLAPVCYPLNQRVFLPAMFRSIVVVGQENLPCTGPVILAPTHRSRWDALLVPATTGHGVTGRYLRFMVTKDEMTGFQGWVIRNLGGFPVDTQKPGVASLRYGIELLQAGEMVVIFPEGGNLQANRLCDLNRLHPGLARLALQSERGDTQVVPMAINYNNYERSRGCDVKISIGTPLLVADYAGENGKRCAKRLTEDLAAAMRELSGHPRAARELVG